MFEFDTDAGKLKAEVTFYTAQVYEAEFQGDIIADIFGVQRMDSGEFSFDDGALVGIDFTKVGWTQLTRALWAAVKTAEPSTKRYAEWVRDMKGLNLWDVRNSLIEEISDCFFRSEAPEEDAEEEN